MVLLRVLLRVAATAAAAALLLLSILSSSSSSSSLSSSFVNAEEKNIALQPFRGVSICAPISVRIVDAATAEKNTSGGSSSNSGNGFSARLVGEKGAFDAVSLMTTGGSSLSVELSRDLSTGAGTLELEIALPAGTLQYVERVHAPGDTVILSEFDREKAEFASSGAGSVWIPFLNGRQGGGGGGDPSSSSSSSRRKKETAKKSNRLSMSKISLSAPGKVVAAGDAGFWEVFTADEGAEVRIDGVAVPSSEEEGGGESPYSTVSVRLDSGKAVVNPAPPSKQSHVSITGFALAPARAKAAVLEYSSGQCSARREVIGGGSGGGGSYGGGATEAAPPLPGSACDKVAALPLPAPAPRGLSWSCAIRTTGSWTCGGPGTKGKPGTVATGTACAATREQVESIARV